MVFGDNRQLERTLIEAFQYLLTFHRIFSQVILANTCYKKGGTSYAYQSG